MLGVLVGWGEGGGGETIRWGRARQRGRGQGRLEREQKVRGGDIQRAPKI